MKKASCSAPISHNKALVYFFRAYSWVWRKSVVLPPNDSTGIYANWWSVIISFRDDFTRGIEKKSRIIHRGKRLLHAAFCLRRNLSPSDFVRMKKVSVLFLLFDRRCNDLTLLIVSNLNYFRGVKACHLRYNRFKWLAISLNAHYFQFDNVPPVFVTVSGKLETPPHGGFNMGYLMPYPYPNGAAGHPLPVSMVSDCCVHFLFRQYHFPTCTHIMLTHTLSAFSIQWLESIYFVWT